MDPTQNSSLWKQLLQVSVTSCIRVGAPQVTRDDHVAASVARHGVHVVLAGQECLAVATTRWRLRSDIGHLLALRSPSGVGVVCMPHRDQPTQWNVSLRGVGKEPQCLTVARAYGGGGHACAAGCKIPKEHLVDVQLATHAHHVTLGGLYRGSDAPNAGQPVHYYNSGSHPPD
jgi:hypothetical protein